MLNLLRQAFQSIWQLAVFIAAILVVVYIISLNPALAGLIAAIIIIILLVALVASVLRVHL